MKVKSIEEISELCRRVASEQGVEFIEAEFKISPPTLTVYVDTEDGIDILTCEKYHRALDGPLDDLDPTFGAAYTLNVSSPGLDRPLKTARDFDKALGQEVEVKLYAPLKGKKFLEGVLSDFDDNTVTLEFAEGQELKIEKNKIAKINHAIKFDN